MVTYGNNGMFVYGWMGRPRKILIFHIHIYNKNTDFKSRTIDNMKNFVILHQPHQNLKWSSRIRTLSPSSQIKNNNIDQYR